MVYNSLVETPGHSSLRTLIDTAVCVEQVSNPVRRGQEGGQPTNRSDKSCT